MVQITARAHRQTLAIHPTVIVVSARKRAAKATFTESPLVDFCQHSLPCPSTNSNCNFERYSRDHQ
jgi:hypothetical protein